MYDPTNAKFISEDPLGFEAEGTNLSAYVLNNPVNYTDPYGEDLYSVLNTTDKVAAGFADVVTKPLSPFGLDSTSIRAKLYGELATRNHDGTAFHVGQGLGVATLVVAGLNTPQVLSNLGAAGTGLVGLEVAHTGYGAYESTRNIIEGCATPFDALSFLPLLGAAGRGAKNASKLDALDEIGDGAKNFRNLDSLDDARRGANQVNDFAESLDELNMKGNPVSPLEKTLERALNPEKYLNDIAEKYNINLSGSGQKIKIEFDPNLPPGVYGKTREVDGGKIIIIGKDALADEGTAANTIAHELSHARDYLRGNIHKPHGIESSIGDGSVYGSGNALEDFIKGNR